MSKAKQKSTTQRPASFDPGYVNAQDRLANALNNLEGLISALHAGADHVEFVQLSKLMNLASELIEETQDAHRELTELTDAHLRAA